VIAHLLDKHYKGDFLEAVQKTVPLLEGAFALAIIHKDHPDQVIAVAHESPMVIGLTEKEGFVASDSQAFLPYTDQAVFLSNAEIAVVKQGSVEVFTIKNERVSKTVETLSLSANAVSKGEFEHYTLKEIFEQKQTVRNAFASRFSEELATAFFEGISEHLVGLQEIERILILGCGTSWHAGYVAAYMIEEMARIPVEIEISSEFRYKNPIIHKNTLVVAISQSGETADTLAAVRELKAKSAKIFAICNVQGSSLVREADYTCFLHAGPEIGVCSTKAFTSQLIVLSLLSLLLARMRHMSHEEGTEFLQALKKLPSQVQEVLSLHEEISSLAKRYARYENFFFLGRQYMFPTSLEGALKLKEISYVNANGYPAGEMKHGPIALINPECPTIALCQNSKTFDKMMSNIMEVKARKGRVVAIAQKGQEEVGNIADDLIIVPATLDPLAPVLSTVVTQLFAYYVAKERGENIDQPRNLAKSVTVE
jgi:glucosamine--fructose-6-phosphate aminotransferase (isomerizing)